MKDGGGRGEYRAGRDGAVPGFGAGRDGAVPGPGGDLHQDLRPPRPFRRLVRRQNVQIFCQDRNRGVVVVSKNMPGIHEKNLVAAASLIGRCESHFLVDWPL